jgi:penicillin-binding protein 1A
MVVAATALIATMPSASPRKTTTPGTGAAGPKSGSKKGGPKKGKGKAKAKGKVAGRETSPRAQGPGKGNKRRKTRKLGAPKQPLTGKQWAWRITKWAALLGLVATAVGACTIAFLFWYWGRDPDLPTVDKLTQYEPKQVVRVATRDGTVVGELFTERRTFVPYDEIPPLMIHAVLSAEDADFFEHQGIDYWGMVRALFVNVKSGKKKQGASTITQQVVKTFLLTPERTLKRKFQEIILARRLEKRLTKEQILTLYLNQIYFGGGRYGVQEAARYYFGKDLGELNIGEAALIAGLPQSPEHLTPKKPKNRDAAKNRQVYVLREMHKHGYISQEEADRFAREPIAIVDDPFPGIGEAPELVEVARQDLIARFGEDAIDQLGGTVVTTVDDDVQALATEALRSGLRAVDERQHYGRPIKRLKEDKIKLELAKLARKLPKKGLERGERYRAVVTEVHDDDGEIVVDLGNRKASVLLGGPGDERYNPKGLPPGERFARGDVIRVVDAAEPDDDDDARRPKHSDRLVALEPGPEGAVVVLDPRTREVLALVGGYDSVIAGYNRATMAKRQAGSTFKPFVYATAIDTGEYTAASIVNDAPEVYDLWKPQNYKKGEHEGPVRLRHALAKSINTVAIRVAHDVTPQRVAEVAHDMGIQSELPDGLSLALGSGEVTPLELTNAFTTFAAGGRYAPPRFIREVAGEPTEPPATVEAIRPEVAYVVTEMMRSVVEEGTGRRASKLRLGVVGKTGTSNDARDAWFVGLTPDLAVGVWIGFDDPRSLGRHEGGGRTAAPVFVELMSELRKKRPMRARKFDRPPGIVEAKIDKASGNLAPEGAPPASAYTEVFIDGSVPTEVATAPGEVDAESYVVEAYEDAYDAYDSYGDGSDEGDGGDAHGGGSPPADRTKKPPAGAP